MNTLHKYINMKKNNQNCSIMSSVSSESAQITFYQFANGDNFLPVATDSAARFLKHKTDLK